MKKLVILAIIVSVFGACQSGNPSDNATAPDSKAKDVPKTPRDMIYKEVMDIHDEAMAKFGTIKGLQKELKNHLSQDTTLSDSINQVVQTQIKELDQANVAMTDWMNNFKIPLAESPDESVIQYLEEQKVVMTEVRKLMFESLEKAQSLKKELHIE